MVHACIEAPASLSILFSLGVRPFLELPLLSHNIFLRVL